ncbi:zinc finger CCCH domain-containing protein 1-like [Cynara cardunculus var. scolymus]|uniref:zinc finger CCCH domain-containing protein 1-like n=1 Tax=Cynara cardunculus var. scolymus TaxID=59895 RepID=UPI000D6315BB|nr:zinc finger CCCH domain-containing protein 1-like [Cynara cardunculus var. scolymus]
MAENGEEKQEGRIYFRKPLKNNNIAIKTNRDEASAVVMTKKLPTPPDNKLHFATSRWFSKQLEKASMFQYDSSKEIQVHNDSRATATLETETEFSRDSRSVRERVLKRADEALKGKHKSNYNDDHKLYKGIHAYTNHKAGFRREQTVSSGFHGPLRAPVHIRTSTRFDYQPDVCKDYKQTGYCGYGDSCKFLHDRGDYKSGWELEKEWNESERKRKRIS